MPIIVANLETQRREQLYARTELLKEIARLLAVSPDEFDPAVVLVGAFEEYLKGEILFERAVRESGCEACLTAAIAAEEE